MASCRTVLFAITLFCLLMLFNIGVEGSCSAWSLEFGRIANGQCRALCLAHERNAGTLSCGKKWCCLSRI
ncbi:hypothetical protein I4U23_027165 [Adineta vaga]|nr:hypothetical protein I4U23_027165 [Adineta vaga]